MGRFLLTWILGVFVYGVSGSLKIDKDSPVYKAYAEADKDLTHLEKHNFETLTAAGRWTIFFGIEGCGHCQRFTPIWLQLQKEASSLFSEGLRVGKVECSRNAAFPTVTYYINGKRNESSDGYMEKEEAIKTIKNWDEKYKASFRKQTGDSNEAIKELQKVLDAEKEPRNDVNPNGQIDHLTDADFDAKTDGSLWFIMFHSPSCSHCVRMAPAWEQLASATKGYINIGKIDATAQRGIARKYGVDRFPTLKIFRRPFMDPIEYNGGRDVNSLQEAVKQATSLPFFEPILSKDVPQKQKESEVTYFLLYNPFKMNKDVLTKFEPIARGFLTQVKFFVCPDEEAYQTLGVKDNTKPSLVVSREHGETLRVFDGDLSKSSTSKDLFSWIQSTKSPLLPQLDEKSQKEVFVMGHLVGLLITDPDVKQSHEKVIATMRSAVKAFEPHQPKTKRVNFAWLDGVRWNSYVISAFQLAPKDYPRLLLIDALESEYFDSDEAGAIFKLDKPEEISDYIKAALEGRLKAKSQLGFLGKSAKTLYKATQPAMELAAKSPFIFALLVVTAVFFGIFVISRLLSGGSGDYEKVTADKSD